MRLRLATCCQQLANLQWLGLATLRRQQMIILSQRSADYQELFLCLGTYCAPAKTKRASGNAQMATLKYAASTYIQWLLNKSNLATN